MSDQNELRKVIGKKFIHDMQWKKGTRPEVQFHAAVSLVKAGDKYSLIKEIRADKIDELIQVAGRFPEQWTGNITKVQIDRVFEEFKFKMITKLRERGVMKAGE